MDSFFSFDLTIFLSALIIGVVMLGVNFPCGYLRQPTKKFSFWWFFWIHAPVPLEIVLRKLLDMPFTVVTIPIVAGFYLLGQVWGRRYRAGKTGEG